jgi:hypothetical protein
VLVSADNGGGLADQADQNYAADNIYDLDCDGSIGLGD